MAITDDKKVDFLWKKITFSVTETDIANKDGPNESIASPLQLFGHTVYAESGDIDTPAPVADTSTVKVYQSSGAVRCASDPSVAGDHTWITVIDYLLPIDDSNRLKDWIPPTIDPSYLIKVYAGDPDTTGIALNPLIPGEEWVFDYVAGVLHFPNNVPSGLGSGLYIEGYRYIGQIGLQAPSTVTTTETLTYTTASLSPGLSEDFTLATGAMAVILETTVDNPCLVEAHPTSARDEDNPYRFKAITGHLSDDGSYVQGGKRFYGPRYAQVISRESPFDTTYWRITNDSGIAASIQLTLVIRKI